MFSLRITLITVLVGIFLMVGPGQGLVCETYEEQKCKQAEDKTSRSCRAISEICTELDHHCFALWEETPQGEAVIKYKGCHHKDLQSCEPKKCFNARPERPHLSFCCCTGDNCNTRVLTSDGAPRPKGFMEILQHEYIRPPPEDESMKTTSSNISSLNPVIVSPIVEPDSGETTGQTLTSTPMTPTTQALVGVTVSLSLALVCLGAFILYRIMHRKIHGRKKAPFDLESAQVMAPLMAKEYENQDGCVLLKNLLLLERKATGRYGEVWKGRLGDVIVAVKITPALEMASWKNEVHIYHKFLMPNPHPNILRFMMSGHRPAEGRMFLVTEYHPLGSLVDLLKGRSITNDEAERITSSMLAGLAFLHDADGKPAIAHRDFKSTNVLIKMDMSACIADFGLATNFEADERIGDKHGQVGTRRYMAPELLEGAISLNVVSFLRVDIYACGMVLWEVLSRTQLTLEEVVGIFKLPLEEELGTTPTNEAVQLAVVQRRLRPSFKPSWRANPRNLSLCLTIEECWDADPEARPSASCLLNRLRQLSTTGVAVEHETSSAPTWQG